MNIYYCFCMEKLFVIDLDKYVSKFKYFSSLLYNSLVLFVQH